MSDLTQWRADIDRIDDQIVDLLTRRFAICQEVAAYKFAHDIPVVLPERIEAVKTRCASRAERQGLDAALVAALYTLIIDQTCETERLVQARMVEPARPPSR